MIMLPEGYTARPATLSDATEVLISLSKESHTLSSAMPDIAPSAFDFLSSFPGFDLASATQIVTAPNEELAAFAETLRMDGPYARVWMRAVVLTGHRKQDVAIALYDWMRKRAFEMGPYRDVYFEQTVSENSADEIGFLEERGFKPFHTYTRMTRELDLDQPNPTWPAGFSVSSFNPQLNADPFLRENLDILREHFGNSPVPDDAELKYASHLSVKYARFDPPLYFAARNHDEVGGICSCYPTSRIAPTVAYIPILSVRRSWRTTGLGTALLLHAFNELASSGAKTVEIHVNVDRSPKLARLCAKTGMQAVGRVIVYQRLESRRR